MNSVRRNAAWGAAGVLSVGVVLSGLAAAPASSVGPMASYPPTTPPTTAPPTTTPPTTPPPTTTAPTTPPPTTPTPTPEREPLPLKVKANKNKKTFGTGFTTLVRSSRTNSDGVIKRRVFCRPLKPTAAGEVRFCRVLVTRKGGVRVKIQGYGRVKVTVQMTARPKPGSRDQWKPTRFRESWTLRGNNTRASSVSAAGAWVSMRVGVAS